MVIKKYQRKNIGEKYISNEGYAVEVVDGGSKMGYCTVRVDGAYEVEAQFDHVKRGGVKNVLHPSNYGVGYFGIGKYSSKTHKKTYDTWNNMLKRCYDPKYHERQPTYKDAIVTKEWHNFQNFAKWFEENYIEGYAIDKDLLSNDKRYSPETCLFIPCALNSFLTNKQTNNKSGCIGVSWDKSAGKWKAQIQDGTGKLKRLGSFTDIQDASRAYKKQRAIYAQEWQTKMQGILPKEAIDKIK